MVLAYAGPSEACEMKLKVTQRQTKWMGARPNFGRTFGIRKATWEIAFQTSTT